MLAARPGGPHTLNAMETNWRDRIVSDPGVLVGKPVIRGTRVSVESLLDLMAEGWSTEDILRNYSHLTADDLRAALRHAAELTRLERLCPVPTV